MICISGNEKTKMKADKKLANSSNAESEGNYFILFEKDIAPVFIVFIYLTDMAKLLRCLD